MRLASIGILLFLVSCQFRPLTVYNQTIDRKYLASTYADTPDPQREEDLIGQRLVVSWILWPDEVKANTFELLVQIQFGNRSQIEKKIPIHRFKGNWIYKLTGEEFHKKNGILTYLVRLYKNGEVVDTFKHQLWCDLIELDK